MEYVGRPDEHSNKLIRISEEVRNEYAGGKRTVPSSIARSLVFVSYSHRDRKWVEQLQSHLSPVIKNRVVEFWADTRIEPGQQWREAIAKAIKRAKVAVLLVSPEFLASDFIVNAELPPLLEAAKAEGLRSLWIPISACLYEATDIVKYQAISSPQHPLDSLRSSSRNKQFAEIARHIKNACDATSKGGD